MVPLGAKGPAPHCLRLGQLRCLKHELWTRPVGAGCCQGEPWGCSGGRGPCPCELEGPVDPGDPVDSGEPVDSGGPYGLRGYWGARAECPGTALPVGSSSLCLALSSTRPGDHGGPAARAGAGAAAAGEERSRGPRSALPALPRPSPDPFQPKRWRAVLRGAPGPHGKSSSPGSPRRYRRWRGNKGAGGPEAMQTAP